MTDEIKAYWDREAGCFKEYNDEFDLTIHFETEEERESFVKSLENYEKLKEAVGKIKDLVEGTIDHFDLEDAMDLLYDIKRVLENTEG